jgi:glyoxylase-like metal-dependent hydrolase (beta-lactamase superfamily II)
MKNIYSLFLTLLLIAMAGCTDTSDRKIQGSSAVISEATSGNADIKDVENKYSLSVVKVTNNVYALVGDTGARSEGNHGLNNTLGFIETDKHIVLIGSGTNADAVKLIEQAIRSVSDKPVSHVINIGTQDHHWMGNHYFAEQGATIVALKKTVEAQKADMDAQLTRLEAGIKAQITSVRPEHATRVIDGDKHVMEIDGITMQLIWPGKGHYAGDAILWLPAQKTVFTGDLVFMDRMLGIHPTSDVAEWQKSFHVMAGLNPEHIIPGHGRPTDLAGAKQDTGNYLDWLVAEVGAALEEWKEIDETIEGLADASQFKHLEHYDSWHRRNIHQTYLQLEASNYNVRVKWPQRSGGRT